jgi:AraC-like DNA-binding protein
VSENELYISIAHLIEHRLNPDMTARERQCWINYKLQALFYHIKLLPFPKQFHPSMHHIPVKHISEISQEPELSGIIAIRDVAEMLAGAGMAQPLHRHDFFFVLILKKGIGFHQIDFVDYEVKDHSVFLMRPGQVHHLTLQAGSSGYLIQFSNDFARPQDKSAQQLLRQVSHLNFCKLDAEKYARLEPILDYLFREYNEKQEGYLEVLKSGLNIFLIELIRHRQSSGSSNIASSYPQEKLDKFLELVEDHVAEHKQVATYAGMLNLSVYQLNSVCKTALGKTPSEVINDYIILEAKRHLLATSAQVNQIAYHLGYEDVSYFIRFFKKHIGHSPEAFRNKLR